MKHVECSDAVSVPQNGLSKRWKNKSSILRKKHQPPQKDPLSRPIMAQSHCPTSTSTPTKRLSEPPHHGTVTLPYVNINPHKKTLWAAPSWHGHIALRQHQPPQKDPLSRPIMAWSHCPTSTSTPTKRLSEPPHRGMVTLPYVNINPHKKTLWASPSWHGHIALRQHQPPQKDPLSLPIMARSHCPTSTSTPTKRPSEPPHHGMVTLPYVNINPHKKTLWAAPSWHGHIALRQHQPPQKDPLSLPIMARSHCPTSTSTPTKRPSEPPHRGTVTLSYVNINPHKKTLWAAPSWHGHIALHQHQPPQKDPLSRPIMAWSHCPTSTSTPTKRPSEPPHHGTVTLPYVNINLHKKTLWASPSWHGHIALRQHQPPQKDPLSRPIVARSHCPTSTSTPTKRLSEPPHRGMVTLPYVNINPHKKTLWAAPSRHGHIALRQHQPPQKDSLSRPIVAWSHCPTSTSTPTKRPSEPPHHGTVTLPYVNINPHKKTLWAAPSWHGHIALRQHQPPQKDSLSRPIEAWSHCPTSGETLIRYNKPWQKHRINSHA